MGFSAGLNDGVYGRNTENALKKFWEVQDGRYCDILDNLIFFFEFNSVALGPGFGQEGLWKNTDAKHDIKTDRHDVSIIKVTFGFIDQNLETNLYFFPNENFLMRGTQ